MAATILDKIVADKRLELERRKREVPVSALEKRASGRVSLDFASALRGDGIRLIAEVKKASPSRGLLCPDFDPVALARSYARGGAAAISVLTEANHFQGSLDYLETIRRAVNLPLLRKDFIFDAYQVYESAASGADALLLIVAILEKEILGELLALSRKLDLECLVEVHDEKEIETALAAGAVIIGINNRDLDTFEVDLDTTGRLRLLVPSDRILVSESGIRTGDDIKKLRNWGINAALVGETLVTARNIPAKMEELAG